MSVEIEKKTFNQIIVYDNFAHTLKSEHLHGGHGIYNFSKCITAVLNMQSDSRNEKEDLTITQHFFFVCNELE